MTPEAQPITHHASRITRYWEIDLLRGVAIVMMVIFHLMWDLHYYGLSSIDVFRPPWLYLGRATATLFLLLVGVSLSLSAARVGAAGGDGAAVWRRQARRGLTVLGAGLLVTLATLLFIPDAFVVFGILHCIGLSMLIAHPFQRLGLWNLPLAALAALAGQWVATIAVDWPWLVWLGLRPHGFASVDYYPLLPWFGLVLVGLAAGERVYGRPARRVRLPDLSGLAPGRLLRFLGRHSLAVYLIHQPVLIALVLLLSRLAPVAPG